VNILVFCDEELGTAGGGSRQVVQLVRALAALGHHMTVVAPGLTRGNGQYFASIGAHVVWVPVPRVPMVRPFAYLVGSFIALCWTIRRDKPDVMLWFDSPGQAAPLICEYLLQCPYVLFVNGLPGEELTGVWQWTPFRRTIQWILREAVRRAKVVVSICPEIPLWMQHEWGISTNRCRVIRNGVDPSDCCPRHKAVACQRLGLAPDRQYIGFVGGFFPWHGLDILVEAMEMIRRECPAAKLLLVGDGQTRPKLEALVHQRGLESVVSFVGRVGFEEVPWWIGASEVCVVLHRPVRFYPGDSMKLWEYLACARPVVATTGEGYGDLVEQLGAGLSVKKDDPSALAEGILRILKDEILARKMGEAGRVAVVRSHTWEARAKELEALFRVVIDKTLCDRVCPS
jgi:glycosyltransferase involved in cell wall biosynthesis